MGQARRPDDRPTGQGSIGRRVMDITRRAWTCYWTHRAARATVGILYALDDRALKDIGLDRSEVESVAYYCRVQGRSGVRPLAAKREVCTQVWREGPDPA